MAVKLIKWLFFGVVLSLVPLLATVSLLAAKATPSPSPFLDTIQKGELLLISAAMCGGAMGDLIGTGRDYLALKLTLGGTAVIATIFASLFYATVIEAAGTPHAYDPAFVAHASIWIFGLSVPTCGGIIALSEGR